MKEAEFDIRLTAAELYVFSMHHTYSAISGIAGLVISFGSLAICSIRYKYLDKTTIMALIIIGLLFTVVQPFMLYWKAKVQVKRNESINNVLHYRLSEEGIEISQDGQQAFVKWYEVRKKKLARNAMYLYMSPVRAFIFPKSQCGGQFDTALAIVNDMMDKYKDYEPEEEDNIKEEESVSGADRKED